MWHNIKNYTNYQGFISKYLYMKIYLIYFYTDVVYMLSYYRRFYPAYLKKQYSWIKNDYEYPEFSISLFIKKNEYIHVLFKN